MTDWEVGVVPYLFLTVIFFYYFMSVSKLQSFLDRPSQCPPTAQKVILLSDSRGKYLEPHKQPGWNIDFRYRSGARLAKGYYWLRDNVQSLVRLSETIHVFIWLGTCDFTQKSGPYITLRHDSLEGCFRYMTSQINRFYELIAKYPSVTLVFLEIPPYCMLKWYEHRKLVISDDLRKQNFELHHRICTINEYIQQKNDCFGVESPRFKLDLVNIRKTTGKPARKSTSFRHYLDGVHPDVVLSQVWLKRLMERSFYISHLSQVKL